MPRIFCICVILSIFEARAAATSCGQNLAAVTMPDLTALTTQLAAIDLTDHNALVHFQTTDDEVGRLQMRVIRDQLGRYDLPLSVHSDSHLLISLTTEARRNVFAKLIPAFYPLARTIALGTVPRPADDTFDVPAEVVIDQAVIAELSARQRRFVREAQSLRGVLPAPAIFPTPVPGQSRFYAGRIDDEALDRGGLVNVQSLGSSWLEMARADDVAGVAALRFREIFTQMAHALAVGGTMVNRSVNIDGADGVVALVVAPFGWSEPASRPELDQLFIDKPDVKARLLLLENLSGVRLAPADFRLVRGQGYTELQVHVADVNRIAYGAIHPSYRPVNVEDIPPTERDRLGEDLLDLGYVTTGVGMIMADEDVRALRERMKRDGLKR